MSVALGNDTVLREITFEVIRCELSEYNNVVRYFKEQQSQYSNSDYKEMTWIILKGNKRYRVNFASYVEYGNKIVELAKLYCVIRLIGGKSGPIKGLLEFFYFLRKNNLNVWGIDKFVFVKYAEYLTTKKTANTTKYASFIFAKDFLLKLQGHPSVSRIEGISLIDVPFPSKNKETGASRFKVVSTEVLKILDTHFELDQTPIHLKVAYWLLRLYALRPSEALMCPLYCVEKISDNIAIMRQYVEKERLPIETKLGYYYHELVYLDLTNSHIVMLFELIVHQQKIALELQNDTDHKGLLLTYKNINSNSSSTLSGPSFRIYLRKIQEDAGISKKEIAIPRDFKKTGITHRTQAGWNNYELRKIAHHKSTGSIDAYSQPSKKYILEKQYEIMGLEGMSAGRFIFKGKIINSIDNFQEKKILSNPRAHKISDMGYCPDVHECGNHFECIACKDLIPDKELESYYYEQSIRYIDIAKKQNELGYGINAKDSLHRATLFADLYHRVKGVSDG